mgnify:CR=1 FL=1
MRNSFLIVLLLISISAYCNSQITENQKIYEKAYRIAAKSENSALVKRLLRMSESDVDRVLIGNFPVYEQLADKFLKFSLNEPLTADDYVLLRKFARVYPISEGKSFIEALTCYINFDWEKSKKILYLLQENGKQQPGILLLLGTMAAYHGEKDSWMFKKILLENPFGTIDFLDATGVIVPPKIEKQSSCRWAINFFDIVGENKELQQSEYIRMKLRYVANQIFQGIEKVYMEKNVSPAEVESVLQKWILHIQKQKLFTAISDSLCNVTYKLKYELKGTTLMAFLEIQRCESSSEKSSQIIPVEEKFIA